MLSRMLRFATCLIIVAGALSAGEKKFVHCFSFTPEAGATEADWQAFFKATDELPGKIPGLNKVWYGKLTRPLTVYSTSDAEARKKLAAGEKEVTAPLSRVVREWGACMEMDNAAALKTYADHPAHKEWEKVYFKVRQYGTNTVDFMGQ